MDSHAPAFSRFAGYEIREDLGSYRGTRRYLAVQVNIGRPVVLHVLTPEGARRQAHADLFDRQLRVNAALRHENVIAAIDAGEFDGCRYFVTEHVEGPLLEEVLDREPEFEVPRALGIALDVTRALVHLEGLHLVHRNVSPRVIVISDQGPARLADFRWAKFMELGAAETWLETSAYVAAYLAPECARGDPGVDSRADVYSLGCVLYHMLTGRPPFLGKSAAMLLEWHRAMRPRDPRRLRDGLPRPVVDVVDRCLRKSRDLRYRTAAALAADLESVIAGGRPLEEPPPGSSWSNAPGR